MCSLSTTGLLRIQRLFIIIAFEFRYYENQWDTGVGDGSEIIKELDCKVIINKCRHRLLLRKNILLHTTLVSWNEQESDRKNEFQLISKSFNLADIFCKQVNRELCAWKLHLRILYVYIEKILNYRCGLCEYWQCSPLKYLPRIIITSFITISPMNANIFSWNFTKGILFHLC